MSRRDPTQPRERGARTPLERARDRAPDDDDDSDATTTTPDPTQPRDRDDSGGTSTDRARRRSGSSSPSRDRTETVEADTTIGGARTVEAAADLDADTTIGAAGTAERAAAIQRADVDFTDTTIGATRTVEAAADVDQSPVDHTAPRIGGTRTVETAAALDQSDLDFTSSGFTERARERPIDSPVGFAGEVSQRVDETEEPGRAARAIDRFTDTLQEQRPVATAGLGVTAASFRTDSGLPIPGTDRRLPGGDDFQRFRDRLDPTAERIDDAIERGVDRATIDPSRAPLDPGDVPFTDPGTTAAAATLGTEVGQTGAQRGVTTGLQAFNPARIAQDASLFAEFGVRGADRTVRADEEELQTGIDVGQAAGGAARDLGPGLTAAAVASDPSRLFSAPATAATIGAVGAGVGTGAAAGARAAGTAGRAARRGASEAADATTTAARRTRRDLDDLDIELTRDPDAGRVDIDLPALSGDDGIGVSPTDAARQIGQRARDRVRRRPRRDDRTALDDLAADARFSAAELRRRMGDVTTRQPRRDELTPLRDLRADARFSVEEAGRAVRDRFRRRPRRDDFTPIQDLRADARFSRAEARRRASGLAEDIEDTLRDFGTTGFIGDTGTGRTRPFLGAADRAAAGRDRVPSAADLVPDAPSRPSRPDMPSLPRSFDDIGLGGGFLGDTDTGRARPLLGAADLFSDRPSRPSTPSTPSIPRSFDDIGIGGEGGFSDLTLRIGSPDRRRAIDVEDLEGPGEAAGVPLFRQQPFEVDPDAPSGPGGFGQIDTDVDLGGGQLARMRQEQPVRRPLDRRATDRTVDRDAPAAFGTVAPFAGDTAADPFAVGADDPTAPSVEPTPAGEFDAGTATGTATDPTTGTGTGLGAGTLVGADTFVGPFEGTGPIGGADTVAATEQPTVQMFEQPTRTGTFRLTGRTTTRTGRIPPLFPPEGETTDPIEEQFEADDDLIDTGILSPEEAIEDSFGFDDSDFFGSR